MKERTDRKHRSDWLNHQGTGVIAAVLYNAEGSAEQAAYILKKVIKELFNGTTCRRWTHGWTRSLTRR